VRYRRNSLNTINLKEKDLDRLETLQVIDSGMMKERNDYELTRLMNYLGKGDIEENSKKECYSSSTNANMKAMIISHLCIKKKQKNEIMRCFIL